MIIFWEDDDYYKPTYVEKMHDWLKTNHIVGQPNAIYYNVQYRWWHCHNNTRHASLCQTGIRPNNLPYLESLCEKDLKFIDIELWKMAQGRHWLDDSQEKLCIGMKGLPGRGGIGSGHTSTFANDPDYSILKQFLGTDANVYFDLLNIRPETIEYPKEVKNCRRDPLGRLILPKPNKQIEVILDRFAKRVEPLAWVLHPIEKRKIIGDTKDRYKDKVCYIVGKGPSMDNLKEKHFDPDCPIIGLNQAIHKIESLNIKNDMYCVQQDSQLGEICWSKRGTMLLPYITSAWYTRHPSVFTYNMEDFNIPNNFHPQSICMATHIAKLWGCKKIIYYGCDSFINGNIEYAKSLNYDIRTKEQKLRANIGEQKRTLTPILTGFDHEFRLAQQ
ncbi:MAG TPA: hypothetical protein PLE74_01155 [Candidatus Cloacimonadota bacterium]|nr:hypothetical protein [Candidatus Cloacimonadota bacterium]